MFYIRLSLLRSIMGGSRQCGRGVVFYNVSLVQSATFSRVDNWGATSPLWSSFMTAIRLQLFKIRRTLNWSGVCSTSKETNQIKSPCAHGATQPSFLMKDSERARNTVTVMATLELNRQPMAQSVTCPRETQSGRQALVFVVDSALVFVKLARLIVCSKARSSTLSGLGLSPRDSSIGKHSTHVHLPNPSE